MNDGNGAFMGTVIGGSLNRGVEVRLDPSFPVESVNVGGFVAIQGQTQRFFGIVSDVALGNGGRIPARHASGGLGRFHCLRNVPYKRLRHCHRAASACHRWQSPGHDRRAPAGARHTAPLFQGAPGFRGGRACRVRCGGRATHLGRQSVGHGGHAHPP